MKNSKLFLCALGFLSLLGAPHALAQTDTDATIQGQVTDTKTGEHLPYITVMLKGTHIGAQTSSSGHYQLRNVPVGSYDLVATAIGYSDYSMSIEVKQGETLEINIPIAEESLSLEAIVVSATRDHTSRRASPTLVNVISQKLFTTTASPTLAEALPFQPGVRVENDCQNCGFAQARINGLCGHYSQILIDSRPVFSALAGVYGLEQIPASMVERIEVVRGGGSALFGASAIGGTINIITKEARAASANVSHSFTSIGVGTAFDDVTNVDASMVTDNGQAGAYIFGQRRSRDSFDANADGFSDIPATNSITLGTRAHLLTSPFAKLSLEYHSVKEYRRGGDQLDRPPHEALIAEQTEHVINSGSLCYEGQSDDDRHHYSAYASAQLIDRNSYYGSQKDPNAYGMTTDMTAVAGAQYSYGFARCLFMPSRLLAGVEYNHDKLHDVSLGYDQVTDQTVSIASAFVQNEWKNEQWSILAGVRIDKHNLIKTPIASPRVNIRYSPVRDLGFRAVYASGFRAPQAFDEDLHISVVGGERVRIRLADNLMEEKSHSFSLSGDWYHSFGTVKTNFMAEGFYILLDNTFALRQTDERADGGLSSVMERYNGSGESVLGCNLEAKASLSNLFSVQAGITFQRSRYAEPEAWSSDPNVEPTLKVFRSPDSYGYLVANYSPIKKLNLSVSGTYTGSMLTPHMKGSGTPIDRVTETPAFWDMGVKAGYELRIMNTCSVELSAAVKNIFNAYQSDLDTGEYRDSGYIYGPALPRSVWCGVMLSF